MFNKTKFPGKPSKLVNKKRVSVLSFDNNFDKRASDHCESDGEKNLASPKHEHGYQTESTTTAKQSSTEESEDKSKPVMTSTATASKNITTTEMDNCEKSENDAHCDSRDKKSRTNKKRVTFRATLETSDQCKVKRVYNPNFDGPLVSIIKKESLNYPILVYKSKCIVRPSRLTEIVKNSANNIDKLNSLKFGREYANQQQQSTSGDEKEKTTSNVIVASKFNLPKLSANSSRVIKPNKRFLFDTGEDSVTNKKKVIKPSFWGAGGEQTSSKDKKPFGFNFIDELDLKLKKEKNSKISQKSSSQEVTKPSTSSPPASSSTSILRKPVLQLSTFSLFGNPQDREQVAIKSPFSLNLNSSNNANISSSIFTTSRVCHVCNSITTRKQPRKYGAVCCELCKKFMSRMIEKVNKINKEPRTIQCDKGDGTCAISPTTIKSHKSLKAHKIDLKALSKGRCYACWLKKCLLNFQLPSPLKARLNNILPKILADATKSSENSNIFLNSMKFPSFKITSNPLAVNNFTFGSKPDIKPNVESVLKTSFQSAVESTKPLLVEIPKEPSLEVVKKSPSPLRSSPRGSPKKAIDQPSTSPTLAQAIAPGNVATSDALRQRVLIKGPRVKHVCRSASLVLGQPIAIFPGDESQNLAVDPILEDENSEKENVAMTTKKEENEIIEDKEKSSTINKEVESSSATLPTINRRTVETFDVSKPITRKVTRPNLTLSQTQNSNRLSSKPIPSSKKLLFHNQQQLARNNNNNNNHNLPPMISIDFWENYDPAEVSRTGFGLIMSEKTPIKSLCFLCGSCGSDPLIFCVCCCEPYHYYCVEDEFNIRFRVNNFTSTSLDSSKNESMNISSDSGALVERGYDMPLNKKLNWLCPRCTVCYTCNMSTGAKVKCQKCEKNYHTTCLGTSKRLLGADRPLICASCLKCKSCGTTNVTKFIGNLPMCSNCFRLRQKGNFCPLCQKCYENNDYDVKMMECGDCRRWVHSKCEGLTDEQYNLLSVLPEHIEFICKKCSPNNGLANIWRESVEAEFKTSLLSVIKLLSKSRHACVLLKLSPRKKSSQCCSRMNCQSSFNSLFDALKTADDNNESQSQQCKCQNNFQLDLFKPSINSIKQNIHDSQYHSLQAFNYDMNKILTDAQSDELVVTYNEIISEIFPWFQNETKACTDALEETMNDHSKADLLDDLMIESENGDYFMMPTFNVPEIIAKVDDYTTQRVFFNGHDTRSCMLCKKEGECSSDEEGRLLYCGHNTWVHTNCALWSAEVYEEIDGSLQNVHSAISRGRLMKCGKCGGKGATVGCNFKNCGEQYHFQCARKICEFGVDKRVFCPQHLSRIEDTRQLETNFEVNRSVYVELDRKKKKTIEASKVRFLIGSLSVTKLGRIVPVLSDAEDYLVPVDFECTRLYWSSRQPWNIVEYKIKISIQRSNYHTLMTDKGINFTVDHSRSHQLVQKNLKQISMFHNSISKEHEIFIQQEETTQDEEPQNNNDLLPPEIKAAIFEDLPHDVLDGISMFDIFPKDPSDSKAAFYNHVLDEDDENSKSNHVNGDGDVDSDLNGFLTSIQSEDCLFTSEYNFARKDESESKKRKLSTSPESNDSNNNQGTKNDEKGSSKFLQLQSKASTNEKNDEKSTKIPQLDGLNDEIFMSDGPVACERCHCTYRNRTSYDRHLSTCEIIQNTTTENDSDVHDGNHVYHLSNTTTTSQHQSITGMGNNNVISMINQQQNQSMSAIPIVINPFGQSTTSQNGITMTNGAVQIPNLQNLSLSIGSDGNLCQNVIVDQQGQQIYAQPLQIGQFGQTATLMPLRNFNQTNVINNGNISYINTSQQQQPTQYLQLASTNSSGNGQQLMTITTQSDHDHQQKIQKKPTLLPSPTKGKTSKSQANMKVVKSTLINGKKKVETKSHQQQLQIVNSKNIQISNYQANSTGTPRLESNQQSTTQNIIFQQPTQQQQQQYPLILNQNGQIVQYIPTDGGQSNAQLPYLTTTTAKDVKTGSQNSFITNPQTSSTTGAATPQQIFQNSFQLPSNNGSNLVLTPNGLSVLPVQSPIVGTLIQQPQALQCVNGVMSTEQMMLGSTQAIEMDPTSGCMYLTTQPVYYGLETIVQNTVMSSQQFVSTAAMQGICQNSSFSATTTQVFQASKIEPIQMEIPTGYVFLNSNDGSQVIHQPQIVDNSSWNIVDEKKVPLDIGSYQKPSNIILKTSSSSSSSSSTNQKQKVQAKINKIQPQVIPTTSSSMTNNTSSTSRNLNTVLKTVNENPLIVKQAANNIQILNTNSIAKKQKATYRTIGPKLPQDDVSSKVIEPTTNVQTTVINLPTSVVNPIQQQNSIFNNLNNKQSSIKSNFQNRPTNRVLPMQASSGTTSITTIVKNNNKIGNIAKGNSNQNGTSGNSGSNNNNNNSRSSSSSPLAVNHAVNNNNNVMPPIQSEISENYCEKIKSIAMELQSSKADELFDALRRSTINNVITVTSNDYLIEKNVDKKLKSPSPHNENFQIPSTSASNLSLNVMKATPTVTKTASVCSLTKTIDSVATGANLLDDRPDSPQPPTTIVDTLPPSITITPIETRVNTSSSEEQKNEGDGEDGKMNIETIFEELPEIKASKSVSEEITSIDEQEDIKAPEKSSFQSFDEETSSERPSTSTGSSYAIKSSREKTPSNNSGSKICGPKILFEIQSQDGFTYKSTSISEIWEKLFETVQLARKAHGLMPLPEGRLNEMTGDQLLGLKTNALKYLLEQLPGVEKCSRYSPKYHRRNSSASSTSTSSFSSMNGNCSSMSGLYGSSSFSSNASNLSSNSSMSTSLTSLNQYMSESDEIVYENFYGCARFEPFSTRSEYDMFSWLASRHRLAPMPVHLQSNNDEVILRRGTGSNLPMAMKYRTLKESYKKSVGVYRSHIHGRGLFCTRDIEAGEMVIEYAGELIRSTLTDKRERYYDSKGIGCYMFKIDDNLVVDATMSGTAARFINHSCDPNCYSKVVDILGRKHIIIFALRRIVTGEELTYDYKFDIEDNKIPCCCESNEQSSRKNKHHTNERVMLNAMILGIFS
ncbi:CLUMA_CG010662, isoform A [Clunio marinus]|uniref:Histone-lysine N-methyltransferase trithorax n=1 Tax=Clunio marinus TaxID=568069 RepID=A0A1J1IBZ2_9DIPT|nr:CLUMA_CG010662, isoform A [Clunio marinus]